MSKLHSAPWFLINLITLCMLSAVTLYHLINDSSSSSTLIQSMRLHGLLTTTNITENITRFGPNEHLLNSFVKNIKIMQRNDEYYILLHLRNWPTDNVLTYSIENNNILYHCSAALAGAGLGNEMFKYWFSRSIAFWFNLNYKSIDQYDHIHHLNTSTFIKNVLKNHLSKRQCHFSKLLWMERPKRLTYYLPSYSNVTSQTFLFNMNEYSHHSYSYDDYQTINHYLLQTMLRMMPETNKKHVENDDLLSKINELREQANNMFRPFKFPMGYKTSLFYLNDVFRQIIFIDTHNAYNKMEKLAIFNETKNIKNNIKTNDIVIHIRCGDIMKASPSNYGFYAMSYYKTAYDVIKNKSRNSDTNENVYLIMQILDDIKYFSDVSQHGKLNDFIKCRIIANEIMNYMKNNIFIEYKYFHLISNATIYSDYYRIMTAPNVICGMSTFCWSASLVNINANVIIWPYLQFSEYDFMPHNIMLLGNESNFLSNNVYGNQNYTPQQIANWLIQN